MVKEVFKINNKIDPVQLGLFKSDGTAGDKFVMDKYQMRMRGHWWFDAGLVGFYQIARKLVGRMETGSSDTKPWPDVNVFFERDSVIVEAPTTRLEPFFKACYEELAERWWNRSTEEQIKNPKVVYYDREKKELTCVPKRMATPIPALYIGGSSWRVDGDPFDKLAKPLQEQVTKYLEENKKELWGNKKKLCYGQPVCHPEWESMKVFEAPKKDKGQVCSICGRTAVCDKVSQTSFPLSASHSATFSFDSDLGTPDVICGECQMLGKFAVQSAFYKKVDDVTYILQLSGGDIPMLLDAHEIFGAGSAMRLQTYDPKRIYFSNFDEGNKTVLQYAKLTYEILWGLYLKAYDLVLDNQQKRYQASNDVDDWDDDDLDEESLRHATSLTVILMELAPKGSTFITKEIVTYSDAAYVFRLIGYIRKAIKNESGNVLQKDNSRFFVSLFGDFLLNHQNPQKPYDRLNGMERNRIIQRVFERKSILRQIEKFVFTKSQSDYPWLGRILFFVTCYEIAIHHRDVEKGEGSGMTKEQIEIAKKLGSQIVLKAKEVLFEGGEGVSAMKSVKGDLFTLRKTRTATDFLEQLNRLQFRYGIVVNKEITSGILVDSNVPFDDFKAYCMISALNDYNRVMQPHEVKNESEN